MTDIIDRGNALAEQHLDAALRAQTAAGNEAGKELFDGVNCRCKGCMQAIPRERVDALHAAGQKALRCAPCQTHFEKRKQGGCGCPQ